MSVKLGQQKAPESLELELQNMVMQEMLVLGLEPGASAKLHAFLTNKQPLQPQFPPL